MKNEEMAKYIKFGIISIRQLLNFYLKNQYNIDNIIWRDMFYNLFHGTNLNIEIYNILYYEEKKNLIEKAINSKSNIPIVDALY